MASDSDGTSDSSAVILRSIREKLVEYKESLLRQLVDEQEAALAAEKERDEAEDKDKSVVEETEAHDAELEQVEDAETVAGFKQDGGVDLVAEESPVGNEEEDTAVVCEKPREKDAVLKKRRLEDAGSPVVAEEDRAPVKKAKRGKTKTRKPAKNAETSVNSDASTFKTGTTADGREMQETLPPLPVGIQYRVVRTSAPPRKYLIQKRREEEASNREALRHQQQPVLLALASNSGCADSNGVVDSKRPVTTPRASSTSSDYANGEFERRLRESVRLHREVNKRSISITRKRQLPRLPTPARGKSHWDFLLQEMKWMATDFAQERNWKRVMQRHLAADVIVARNAESVRQENEDRQMARGVALQVSAFWRTMERIAARSRVRFEAAGTESSTQNDADAATLGDQVAENDSKRGKSEEIVMSGTVNDVIALKYHTIDVATSGIEARSAGKGRLRSDAVVKAAKTHMTYIVSAGKRARSAMTSSSIETLDSEKSSAWSLREAAFRELHARCTALQANGGPTIILAAFQLLALRWMLELYSSGLNIFLNDQLGMGKAATIVAFLSLIEIVASQQRKQETGDGLTAVSTSKNIVHNGGPHLIIVAEEELHKWRYYLRIWYPDRRIQLYDGMGKAPSYREQLQREWKTRSRDHAEKSDGDFLVVPPDDEDEDMEDDERAEPVFCVLCPVNEFAESRDAFVAFTDWQFVVVENEHDGIFDDPSCVSALQQLRQQQRRVLCNSQPVENWRNIALRLQYADFLVREAYSGENNGVPEINQHRVEMWPSQDLLVDRASVVEVMQLYGKSASARASLWKAVSHEEDAPQYINSLHLALSCLSLRRVRSEVEPELGKIEEISLSCQPTPSQTTQYRNALSGFGAVLDAAGGREERLDIWLQLFLRLREICNCVDIVNDMDKLAHADLRLLTSCSAKLEALEPLLRRLTLQERKKVVIYCQLNAMFPILELFLTLLDINFVRVTGSTSMQYRALCHFADRPVVRVALVSTRLSMSKGKRAASVFGGEAIVVVDSDWNATCDAKLRASWAKMAVGGADILPVYRLHCENTIEASLLRVGASLTEKVFGEMNPQELLAVPSDMILSLNIEKPSWWSSNSNSGGNGLGSNGAMTALANVAQQVEISEKYCGDSRELEMPLLVHNMDLDAEEHLLLANTDELTPVEWYAVNYVHGVTDKKQQQKGDCFRVERDDDSVEDEIGGLGNENGALFQSEQCSFEELAKLEADRQWQDGDAASQLFYYLDDQRNVCFDESALEKPFMQMRMEGMETHFDVYKPPQPPSDDMATMDLLLPEPGTTTDNQMTFRVSYRVPAPPPLPLPGKSKLDHAAGLLGDKAGKFSKKQRANSAGMSKSGISGVGLGSGTGMTAAGVKRKLESQLGGVKSGSLKEQRVDLEGIPVPDVSAFADDDFWGDTNLDALDSAEWDDQALLSGILGVGGAGTASSTASSSGTASSGVAGSMLSATGGAISAGTESGHVKAGSQKSKKSKTAGGSGRPRKSSMSGDSGRDAWSVHDDIVLKKLFELYGANWTLIAQVFNSATAVSRFFCKKRSPRQCYDRYGKIISGSLATSTTASNSTAGANASKDGKSGSSLKAQRAAAAAIAAASQLTPAVLDVRIGLPRSEMLLAFPYRHSLPGLPPPSIVGTPSLVEMTLKHRKKQVAGEPTTGKKSTSASGGGLDDLKSIRSSFDAIIQCMKHKTSPPPIPIPVGPGAGTTTNATSTSGTSSSSTDLGTKASLTAAPFPASAPPVASAPTKTDSNSQTDAGSKAATGKGVPVVVPPPHKSHTDMISLLPAAVLGPDEVIKRSKEAAVVAVQAAAAVASVSRDGSPLSASGDVMLGAGSGFGASVAGSMPRRSHAASITSEMMAPLPPTVPAAAATSGAPPQATTAAWGDMQRTMVANGLNSVDAGAPGTNEADTHAQRNPPMPVTTSTLLHVLDRMPEIKNKIQAILNRTDCSESQKVAMIARLLSNTNAINNNASSDPPDATAATSSAVLSALTADAAMLSSSGMLVDSETAIPMPASLNASAPPTSSASAPSGQYQPPASQS